MKKYFMLLSLCVGLFQVLSALDLEVVNNSNTPLPLRLKSYEGARKLGRMPGISGLVYFIDPVVILKRTILGENFDHTIPAHESLIIKNFQNEEVVQLGGRFTWHTVPLEEARKNPDKNGLSRIIVTPSMTGYTYSVIYKQPERKAQEASGDIQTDVGEFTQTADYEPEVMK